MGAYFIFPKDTAPERKASMAKSLEEQGYRNSHKGVSVTNAVGVCSYCTADTQSYTFLDERMAGDNPSFSWTIWRTKIETPVDFLAATQKEMTDMLARLEANAEERASREEED